MILRSVGVLSAGKVSGALCMFIGLFLGGFMALMSLLGAGVQAGQGNNEAIPALFVGVGSLIFIPVFYGIFGFISGIIYAAIYNLLAGMIGGLEMNFERRADLVSTP
jgi:hypothetical protein